MDTHTLVPIPETSGEVTIDNTEVVVKDKVTNPLEPASDVDGDPIEDRQGATGLNEDIVLIYCLFFYYLQFFESIVLKYLYLLH